MYGGRSLKFRPQPAKRGGVRVQQHRADPAEEQRERAVNERAGGRESALDRRRHRRYKPEDRHAQAEGENRRNPPRPPYPAKANLVAELRLDYPSHVATACVHAHWPSPLDILESEPLRAPCKRPARGLSPFHRNRHALDGHGARFETSDSEDDHDAPGTGACNYTCRARSSGSTRLIAARPLTARSSARLAASAASAPAAPRS